jgi:glycosyltransferase involved in cell wall biosynthesis
MSRKTMLITENNRLRSLVADLWQRDSHIIYPGVDLCRFSLRTEQEAFSPYRAVFASSPLPRHHGEKEDRYLVSRGIPETIAISHRIGEFLDFETTLLWRKDPSRVRQMIGDRGSVRVSYTYIHNMNEYLESYELCFALFRDTSHVKSVPQSVVECLSKGIPVVSRHDSALGAFLSAHKAGFTVPADEPSKAAWKIVCLLRDRSRYRSMSLAARRMAMRYFSLDGTVDQYLDLYHSVA